jgi:DNA-directed RNA polymerase specialized sigma24 family protein
LALQLIDFRFRVAGRITYRYVPSDAPMSESMPTNDESADGERLASNPPQAAQPSQRADSVGRLFREHNRSLVSYLAMRLRSVHEAKEVAQEAYVRVLQLDQPGAMPIVEPSSDDIEREVELDEPERGALAREQLEALVAGLQELPEKCREAFLMFRLDGLSQQQIAARLGVTERMVRNYINEALIYCRMRAEGASPREAREGSKR